MAEQRLLVGHKSMVTYCIASRQKTGLVATSAEDGCICCFDTRCKDLLFRIEVGGAPVSSICFKTGDENIIYASCGTMVKSYDVRMVDSLKPLDSYDHNKEEINQVTCNSRSSFVAAADDSGEVKVIDIQQKRLYKSLKHGHTNICSTVQFVPWRPWEVITGGLDSKLVLWDFSKGRPNHILDLGGGREEEGKVWNPGFVHSVVVPDLETTGATGRVCAVGRGDGVVQVVKVEGMLLRPKEHSVGSHSSAVSCLAFGERGTVVISGGNDRRVKVWDLSTHGRLSMEIRLNKKVNWLCTIPFDSDNLLVCDTSNTPKLYSLLS